MKITVDITNKTIITVPERVVQNSSGEKDYIYGVEPGWLVKATYSRADGFLIGPVGGTYDIDSDSVYSYVISIPAEALYVQDGLGVSIAIYEPLGTDPETYRIYTTVRTSRWVYPNDSIQSPEDLTTVEKNAINIAIGNLTANKVEVSAIVGTAGEIASGITKDTEVDSKLKSAELLAAQSVIDQEYTDAEIFKIEDGTYTAKKAEQDDDGNDIVDTYETKVKVAAEINKIKDGTYFAKRAERDDNGNVIKTTYLKKEGGTMSGVIAMATNKITGLGDGADNYDAATIHNVDTKISTHNTAEAAHTSIRTLIEDLEREVARFDNRGKSYGEIPYTTLALKTLAVEEDVAAVTAAIKATIESQTWFTGTYTPSIGDLVYDTGVGEGINYHEWEYNGEAEAWVDNGAIASPKASNNIFGTVKGGDYVSIVAGIMQILLADNATYLKDSASTEKYTYSQIKSAIDARYTKTEVDTLLDSLKAIYGWEQSDLGTISNAGGDTVTKPLTDFNGYDFVLITANHSTESNTMFVKVSDLIDTDNFILDTPTSSTSFKAISTNLSFSYDTYIDTVAITLVGIKMDGTVHNEMRSIGDEVITYKSDGKVLTVVSDTVTTTPTFDVNGNLTKITEMYALDSKTYETTFIRNKNNKIISTNKVEV